MSLEEHIYRTDFNSFLIAESKNNNSRIALHTSYLGFERTFLKDFLKYDPQFSHKINSARYALSPTVVK